MARKKITRAKPKSSKPRTPAKAVSKPPKRVKGRPPHFFDDPAVDKLLHMVMNLAAEISILRDRLDTHEHLSAKGNFTATDVEAFAPSDDVLAAREAWRTRFLDRLLKTIDE